jgi:hypothetical protein
LLPYTKQMSASLEEASRQGWSAGRSIIAFGIRIGVRTNRPDMLEKLLALIPYVWKPCSGPVVERLFSLRFGTMGMRRNGRSPHTLYEDSRVVDSSADLDWVLESFERQVKIYLAEMAPRRVFVHAGAVGWQGKAIIVPGRSYTGKTSLVAELVRAGATYYSDEYAVLDKYGRVHPYPAPLAVREPGSFKQKRCPVEEFGGNTGIKPLPVGLVVVSQYKPGKRPRHDRLSAGQAMLELLANTVPARRKPEIVMTTLQKIVSEAVVLKGVRGEAKETTRFILENMIKAAPETRRAGF